MFSPIFFLPPPTNVITILDLANTFPIPALLWRKCLCVPLNNMWHCFHVIQVLSCWIHTIINWFFSHYYSNDNSYYCMWFYFIHLYDCMLLLLSRFSRVWLCATPQTAAHQAPPSLGFSRQEYWSGLPYSSPMHKSEKSKWSRSVVSDSSRPQGLQPTRLLCPWDFPGKSTGVGCHCLLRAKYD